MSESSNTRIDLDNRLREFLREVRAGQSLSLAAWAARILQDGMLTLEELERCFAIGFED